MDSTEVDSVQRVFRSFVPGDTLQLGALGVPVSVPDLSTIYLLYLPAGTDVPALVAAYQARSEVLYAEPNYYGEAAVVPNDPQYAQQPNLQTPPAGIDVAAAWDEQVGTEGVKLGIVDSGIDWNHPDLGRAFGVGWKVVGGADHVDYDGLPMDEQYHGTHVAGIAGALTHNTDGGAYVGIAGGAGGVGLRPRLQ
jgi:thermitase